MPLPDFPTTATHLMKQMADQLSADGNTELSAEYRRRYFAHCDTDKAIDTAYEHLDQLAHELRDVERAHRPPPVPKGEEHLAQAVRPAWEAGRNLADWLVDNGWTPPPVLIINHDNG